MAKVRTAVRTALRFASVHRALGFDDAARERWIDVYPQLSSPRPGLAGAATARAEAHVVRLSLIYALLDLSEQICLEHLEAALAVWRYSANSAVWVFGDSLGDPTADEIWSAARERPAGVTRTEVSDLFSRNKKRREIERALTVLEEAGRLRRETRHPERGRAAEVWIPVLCRCRLTASAAPGQSPVAPVARASLSATKGPFHYEDRAVSFGANAGPEFRLRPARTLSSTRAMQPPWGTNP